MTCPYCDGHGWIQTSYDPDRDEDCVMCKENK